MFDTIIIGCGPAAMSASIYLKNANKKVLIIEKNAPGGKILKTEKINNYLGFNEEDASTLAYKMYDQTNKLGIPIKIEKVIDVKDSIDKKIVTTDKNKYEAKTILIACGRVEKPLGIENEDKLNGHGVSYCVKCDASLYKDKIIAIVSNTIDDVLYLSDIASKVIFINNSNEIFSIKRDNIEVINNEKIIKINQKDNVISSITLSNNNEYNISCLFIETGYTPNIDFIKSLNIETKNNYIITDDEMRTNINGIYASGDIVYKKVYQIINAASEGALAALSIIKYLNKE
ncbi:MAG: FAD-dependent oxidoreductase [Bacilli bacterium]|nr:FAD-dependent oxidoreductase [Bacilli bacterium]